MDKDTLRSPGDQSVPAQRRRLLPVGTAKRWAGLQGDAPQEPARCPGPRFAPAPSRINTQTLLSTVLPVAGPVEPASRMPPPGRLPSAVSSPSAPTPSRSTTGAAFSSATSRWPSTPTSSPAPTTSRRIRRRCRPCWGRADRREVILWRGVAVERGRKELEPGAGADSIPSSCPSPSGEGTQGLGVRAESINRATGPTSVPDLSRWGASDGDATRRDAPAKESANRRCQCPSTHPVPPSPGRGRGPNRLGREERVRNKQSKPLAPAPSPDPGLEEASSGRELEENDQTQTSGHSHTLLGPSLLPCGDDFYSVGVHFYTVGVV